MTMLLPKPVRIRSQKHLIYIRSLRCSVPGCTETPVHAHHITTGPEPRSMSMKPSDRWCVPLSHSCHRRLHDHGERQFWDALNIDPVARADRLWKHGPEKGRDR